MTDWTKPRAYIVKMNGRQFAEFHRHAQAKAEQAYQDYVASLEKKYSK